MIKKRKYPYSLFPTDEETDAFFDKYKTPMKRFEAVLERIAKVRLSKNPCPFKDCPNRKERIQEGNVVQFQGVLLDSQICLDRYMTLKQDKPKRWCYFDEKELSHHVYPFTDTSKKGLNSCFCGLKEQVYDYGAKGWVFKYKEEEKEFSSARK